MQKKRPKIIFQKNIMQKKDAKKGGKKRHRN